MLKQAMHAAAVGAAVLVMLALVGCEEAAMGGGGGSGPVTAPTPDDPPESISPSLSCPDLETLGNIRVSFSHLDTLAVPKKEHYRDPDSEFYFNHSVLGALRRMSFTIRNVGTVPVHVMYYLRVQEEWPNPETKDSDVVVAFELSNLGIFTIEPGELKDTGHELYDGDTEWYFGNYKLIITWADKASSLPSIDPLTPDVYLSSLGSPCLGNTVQVLTTGPGVIQWSKIPPRSVSLWQFHNHHATIERPEPYASEELEGFKQGEVTVFGLRSPGSPARPPRLADAQTGYAVDCSITAGGALYELTDNDFIVLGPGTLTGLGLSGCGRLPGDVSARR